MDAAIWDKLKTITLDDDEKSKDGDSVPVDLQDQHCQMVFPRQTLEKLLQGDPGVPVNPLSSEESLLGNAMLKDVGCWVPYENTVADEESRKLTKMILREWKDYCSPLKGVNHEQTGYLPKMTRHQVTFTYGKADVKEPVGDFGCHPSEIADFFNATQIIPTALRRVANLGNLPDNGNFSKAEIQEWLVNEANKKLSEDHVKLLVLLFLVSHPRVISNSVKTERVSERYGFVYRENLGPKRKYTDEGQTDVYYEDTTGNCFIVEVKYIRKMDLCRCPEEEWCHDKLDCINAVPDQERVDDYGKVKLNKRKNDDGHYKTLDDLLKGAFIQAVAMNLCGGKPSPTRHICTGQCEKGVYRASLVWTQDITHIFPASNKKEGNFFPVFNADPTTEQKQGIRVNTVDQARYYHKTKKRYIYPRYIPRESIIKLKALIDKKESQCSPLNAISDIKKELPVVF
jgi:hypothetical protein